MTDQFHDFDAAWAEEEDEPVVLHNVLGRDWECKRPSEVPAALLLKLDRLMLQVGQELQTGKVADDFVVDATLSSESILRQLAGDDNVTAWLAGVDQPDGTTKQLPYKRLMDLNRHLLAVYRGQDPGEAPAANRATRRAAKKKGSGSAKS